MAVPKDVATNEAHRVVGPPTRDSRKKFAMKYMKAQLTFSTVSWCLLGCGYASSGSQPFYTELTRARDCGSAHDLTAPAFLNLIVDCELEGSSCSDLTAPPFSSSIVNLRAPRSALTLMTPHNISPPSNVSATPHAPSGRPSPKGSVSSSIRRSKYSSVVIAAQRNECGASDTLIRIE